VNVRARSSFSHARTYLGCLSTLVDRPYARLTQMFYPGSSSTAPVRNEPLSSCLLTIPSPHFTRGMKLCLTIAIASAAGQFQQQLTISHLIASQEHAYRGRIRVYCHMTRLNRRQPCEPHHPVRSIWTHVLLHAASFCSDMRCETRLQMAFISIRPIEYS